MNRNQIYLGDCLEVAATFPNDSFDLIMTSPPYADQRKNTYGGIDPDNYVEWFLPRSEQFKRILKSDGSFILNIKEKAVNGERHTYVLNLILALRQQGWLWTEEYIWHKRTPMPGKWPNRFRDSWERCLHFTKQRQFKMYQDAVMVRVGDWKDIRMRTLGENDIVRHESDTNSGFGINKSNFAGREMVYPTNVLHLSGETTNQGHSAAFPIELPAWFIKLFTLPGDVVLDPFFGSGTTGMAALAESRDFIGIEKLAANVRLAEGRLSKAQLRFSEMVGTVGI